MARNIVLLSDGTGNSAAKLFKTNVWRLYGALDLSDPARQVACYDNGVGTSSFRPLAILGGVFGFGLKRNVLHLYRYACRNYKTGDRIFGFGFSRGAFTIRVVAGLIARVGLVPYEDEAQLARDAVAAYRTYRSRFKVTFGLVTPLRHLRDGLARLWRNLRRIPQCAPVPVDAIHFVGVWDTVAAYGGPIEEVTWGIDTWIWPLSMPDRFMSAKIRRACHALALDDERNAFWPVLWDEDSVSGQEGPRPMYENWTPPRPGLPEIDRQRLSQVWFTGMHSDVGGGYAQDGLSYVTLDWMMDRAEAYDLILRPDERDQLRQFADPFDRLNDSRHGLAGYYRYKPRKLSDLYRLEPVKPTILGDIRHMARAIRGAPAGETSAGKKAEAVAEQLPSPMIHESVFRRIAADLDGYAPIVLPEAYRVTTKAGEVRSGRYEDPTQATVRARRQERVWNQVWLRRVVYFATVFASLYVAALPMIVKQGPAPGAESRAAFLIPLINALGGFLPAFAAPWIEAFRASPTLFALGVVLVAGLMLWGGSLQRAIDDAMLKIWHPAVDNPPQPVGECPVPSDPLYRTRTSKLYRGFFYALTHWIVPALCAALILYALFVGVSRALFAVGNSVGVVCGGGDRKTLFDTRSLCHATGVTVAPHHSYEVTIQPTGQWWDGYRDAARPGIPAGPDGFGGEKASRLMAAGIPLRRHLTEKWFAVIARIGSTGNEELALRFEPCVQSGQEAWDKTCKARFRAPAGGEVFLFVNDSVIGVPRLSDLFYRNNRGEARVTITEVPSRGRH